MRTKTLQPPPNIDAELNTLDASALPTWDAPADAAGAKAARRHLRTVARRRFARLEQHAAAIRHLDPLPAPGESLHGVMDGRFSAWSLATAIVDLLDEPVDQLTISTLGFNRENAASLIELLDAGKVREVLLNVSNYFRHSDRTIFADIRRELESRGQRVVVTRSHAKLILLRTATRSIVVESSANLRSSQNYEQFLISDDAALLDFHRTWIEELATATEETCNEQ